MAFSLQITYVDPSGLATEHGLPKHAKCIEEDSYCNWWITEINNRPLNLSFKGNEVCIFIAFATSVT